MTQPGTDPTSVTDQWVALHSDVEMYQSPDVDEMTMCALAVTEELRGRLIRRLGPKQLDVARIVAGVLDCYAREQITENTPEGEDSCCNCEEYGCNGECCGKGRCSCTPGFVLAVQLAAQEEESGGEHGLNIRSGSWMCKCGKYHCPQADLPAKKRPSACPTHGAVLDCADDCEGRR
jgi:hypothetical protein